MGAARGRTPVNCGYLRSLSVGGATRSITSTSVGNRSCRVWCGSAASLVVEDEIELCEIMGKALELSGYTVIGARDGKDALEKVESTPGIDLVLMDVMMPGMDGYETTRAIRERAQFRGLPIIALTAKAMKGDREKCIAAGASDYITKPVDTDQLLSLMRVWLYR